MNEKMNHLYLKKITDISKEIPLADYEVFNGTLAVYYETGFESQLLHLFSNDPKFIKVNDQHNPRRPELGPEYFKDLGGIIDLKPGDVLVINETDLYILGNKELSKKHNYNLSIFPHMINNKNFDLQEWYNLFSPEIHKGTVYRKKKSS